MNREKRADYLTLLQGFEANFSDTGFQFQNFDLWPVLKIQVGYQLHLLFNNNNVQEFTAPPLKPGNFFSTCLSKYRLSRELSKAKSEKVLIAYFEGHNSDSLLSNTDVSVNSYTFPFELMLREMGVGYDVLPLDNIQNCSCSVIRAEFRNRRLLKLIAAEKLSSDAALLANIEAAGVYLSGKDARLTGINHFLTGVLIDHISIYWCFKRIFKACKFESLIFYCYYNHEMMALNRAARECDITTIEYQHSQQSDQHFAYSGWTHRIGNSSNLFPKYFWFWSNGAGRRIMKNFSALDPSSKAIVGGNLHLSCARKMLPLNPFDTRRLKILICLQGLWIPQFIEDVIRDSVDVEWYFRLHPRYPNEKQKLAELEDRYPGKINVSVANTKSLYELFTLVGFNITSFSGTALEAQAFEVQNIIFGEEGLLSYKHHIDAGEFLYVANKKDLEYALRKTPSEVVADPIVLEKNTIISLLTTVLSKNI